MTITPQQITDLIRKRRSVLPKFYVHQEISKEILEEVLENANWAPTHRLTQPWRFKVFSGGAVQQVAQYMGNFFKQNTAADQYTDEKYEKSMENPSRSSVVIAICMQVDAEKRIPEWEEILSTGAAVQNMWLTCAAYGIGGYWSTPRASLEANEFLNLKEGERCLGFFYMGYHEMPEVPGKRTPIAEKVQWL